MAFTTTADPKRVALLSPMASDHPIDRHTTDASSTFALAIQDDDDDENGADSFQRLPNRTLTPQPHLHHASHSYRHLHRVHSKPHLTRLESFIHPDHSKALLPTRVLYLSILIALLGPFQSGWLLSQLNYLAFNSHCLEVNNSTTHSCLVFSGHSKHEWTMAVTAWIVGAALGAALSGVPADCLGRKRTLGLNALVMIAGASVQVAAPTIYIFAAGRLVSGVASGTAINVSNVLISEVAPCQMRGLFATGVQASVSIGSLGVTTAHYAMGSSTYAWRFLVGVPLAIGAALLLLVPFMAPSPVWLVAQGQIHDAEDAMRRLYQPTNVHAIVRAVAAAHADEQREIAASAGGRPWRLLVSPKYRRQLGIAVVLCVAQQFGGINAIMYYSASIFNSAGVSDPRVANTLVNVIRTLSILAAAKIMDKFHRRTLLMGGMSVMALTAAGLVVGLVQAQSIVAVVAVCLYIVAYCLSIGPMAWMVSAELFPDFLHAAAGSVGTMCTWIANFCVGVFYPVVADALGAYSFMPFVGCLVLFVLFVCLFVPETAQKPYAEIQRAFGIDDVHEDMPPTDHDPWANADTDEASNTPTNPYAAMPGLPIDEDTEREEF
ncbi:Aste57867_18137 [Aphanomyces stellatus]|uniref:Hexose transporter 1 n=1 Tax=Aphanomyces stellatus TaxID=120398 RepID=A0A485L9Y4_9STRA|nr:hypothetical protein As57867_018075 [Aphanomyces stellatus]VFT94875.1 Aste57867_18137 [Aphanomyces stellatus]